MASVGLLLKSYAGDLAYAERLVASLDRHNVERLPTWIVVPDSDLELFAHLTGPERHLIAESALDQHLVTSPIGDLRTGYANQEIIKLAFWELGLVDVYLPIDSDAVIVRDFGRADLMYDHDTPFTVLVEDNDLKVDPRYFHDTWVGRERALRRIQEEVGLADRRLLTSHGHQVMSSRVLRSLRDDFMAARGWSYADLLGVSPYEFSWYAFWLQASGVMPIHVREPLIKVLHTADQHLEYAMAGITPVDVARGYLGIVVNSNFARSWGDDVRHDEDAADTIARYVPWGTLLRSVRRKAVQAACGRIHGR